MSNKPLLKNKVEPVAGGSINEEEKAPLQNEKSWKDPEREFKSKSLFLNTLAKFTRCIIPFFILCFLGSIGCLVGSVLDIFPGHFIIIVINFIGAIVGAIGVFRWGTVSEQIKLFKQENNKYATEIDALKKTGNDLKENVGELTKNVNALSSDANELQENIKEFDELRESLADVGKDQEEIFEMITGLNTMFDDMNKIGKEAARARLLEAYYNAEMIDDGEQGLSKREWKRLTNRLPDIQREAILKLGDFDTLAGDDKVIDLFEFQQIINKVLDQLDNEIMNDLNNNN